MDDLLNTAVLVRADDLRMDWNHTGQLLLARHDDPRRVASEAIERHEGNRSRAARSLGVSRSTLYRWLSAAPVSSSSGLTLAEVATDDGPQAAGS